MLRELGIYYWILLKILIEKKYPYITEKMWSACMSKNVFQKHFVNHISNFRYFLHSLASSKKDKKDTANKEYYNNNNNSLGKKSKNIYLFPVCIFYYNKTCCILNGLSRNYLIFFQCTAYFWIEFLLCYRHFTSYI